MRAALLASTALAGAAAWTVAASATALAVGELWSHPFYQHNPAWAWAWWSFLRNPVARADQWPALAAGFAVASAPIALAARAGMDRLLAANPLHGRTGWLTDREAKAGGFRYTRLPDPDSIVVGTRGRGPFRRYVGLPGEEHAALTAKTRSGKGVAFVNVNALNWGGSLVSFSVKRDVFEGTAGHRARMGDRVFVFDLSDPLRRTHRWNPLGAVRRGQAETYGDIYRAMWFLVPETKANNPYFQDAGRKMAAALAVILAETPGARLNVSAVLRLVQRPDWAENLSAMIEEARDAGRPYSLSAANVALWMIENADEKEVRDIISTVTTALALWDDPVVAGVTAESDFDVGELRSERMAVYVCGGPSDIRIYRPIYGLFFQQLVQRTTRDEFGRDPRHRHRALGILDEFWALGKQDVLADASAFTASYGLRWAYVQQSEEQSVAAFGKEGAANLFTNTGARLDFGGMDRDAAEKISKWAGNNTVRARSRSRARFMPWLAPQKATESESEQARPLVLPQEIQRLDAGKLLVRRGNLHLFKLERVRWYSDPWFKHLGWSADPGHKPLGPPPPAVPPLAVAVEREDVAAVRARRATAAARAEEALHRRAEAEQQKAEGKRTEAERRLAQLRAAHQVAVAQETGASAEAVDAAAKATEAAEMARAARQKAKEGGNGAEGADEVAEAAARAARATETARQAKLRATAAARDAEAAGKRFRAAMEAARVEPPTTTKRPAWRTLP